MPRKTYHSRFLTLGLALLISASLFACGGGGSSNDSNDANNDVVVEVDAGIGCAATDPRSGTTSLIIGPSQWEQTTARIAAATTSLDVQMYLFTVDEVADAVVAAKNRGVAVRVLLDPDHEGNPDVRGQFQAAGVPVRNAPGRFMFSHAKYLIIDGAEAVVLSGNFNYGAYNSERNYGILLHDPDDLDDLKAIFDADWNGDPEPDLSCTRLVVSPVNSRSRVIAHIVSAQTRLDVEASYLSESSLRASVIEAKNRGVMVRVLLADPADYDANAATITIMRNQGIPVKYVTAFSLHAKVMVADDAVLIGSQNFSNTSINDNREVGVIVTDPGIVTQVETQFGTDWAGAVTP